MRYTTRLYLGFGMIILTIILLIAFIVGMLSQQNEEMNSLVEDRYEKIKLLNQVRVNVKSIDRDLNVYIHGDDEVEMAENISNIKEVTEQLLENLTTLEKIIALKDAKEELTNLRSQVGTYQTTVEQIITWISIGNRDKALSLNGAASVQFNELINTSDRLISIQEMVMEDTIINAKASSDFFTKLSLWSIIIVVILGVFISLSVIGNIRVRFRKIRDVMKSVQYGSEHLPRLKIHTKDEIGEIAEAYNEMATALEEHERAERKYTEEIENQNWLSKKLVQLSLISQEVLDLKVLGEKYLRELIPIVEASYGALYIRKEDNAEEPYLLKIASYAGPYDESKGKEKIMFGEGLVGQCAKDGKPIQLKNIPSDYISISSSLGETRPNKIVIFPIILEDTVMGVLELASLEHLNVLYEKLLMRTTNQLGITIYRIHQQMKVRALLEEAQGLNEELQTQSEELQLQQEELRTMNEELEAQYKHSEQKTKDLELTQQELEERTRQLELGSKYKSQFLANMSHELRTPLNSMLILAQILQENKENHLSESEREYAATIYAAGRDLLHLINDILDLAKIESGKVDFHVGELNIRDTLDFTKKQFEPLAGQKGIELSLHIVENVPASIETDEQKVFLILKNLLSNAIKFTERGSVKVNVERQYLQEKDEDYIAFTVVDTGIGIAAENKQIIFEAFQQEDGTTSRKYGGTGLGLSISKELAQLLGGFITVESIEGEGSVFTLYLPVHSKLTEVTYNQVAAAEENESLYPSPNPSIIDSSQYEVELAGKKVLVVDDDMRNIFSLTTALEAVGMNVVFAENGREGLEVLDSHRDIDIVLMDIMMPEIDGYEAMRRIRAMEEYKELPVIALTSKAMSHDRKKCIDAGASDYITKPVKLEQLFSVLKVWLHDS